MNAFSLAKTAAFAATLLASLSAAPAFAGYMSFAVDNRGNVGHGLAGDPQTARNFALSYCGKSGCNVISTTTAKCNALYHSFEGGYWFGVGAAPTQGAAMGYALNFCAQNAPAATCKLAYKFCQ